MEVEKTYRLLDAIVISANDKTPVFLGLILSVIDPKIGLPKPLHAANGIMRVVIKADASVVPIPAEPATSKPTGFAIPIAISPASVPIV